MQKISNNQTVNKFSDSLKAIMIREKITSKRLASELGITEVTVSKWRKGHAMPTGNNLQKLSSVLGVSAQELFGIDTPSTYEEFVSRLSQEGITVRDLIDSVKAHLDDGSVRR